MEALTKRAQMAETEAAALRRSFDQDTALLREQNITTQGQEGTRHDALISPPSWQGCCTLQLKMKT